MSERATDRVLRTDELIREIFRHLDSSQDLVRDGLGSKGAKVVRGALYSAALCCRAFCEPAFDVLWRYQEHFFWLLGLLPYNSRDKEPFVEFTFSKPLEEDDWASFAKYAKRVRVLNVHQVFSSVVAPEFRYVLYEMVFRLPRLFSLSLQMDMSLPMVRRLSTLTNVRHLCFDADRVEWDGNEPAEPRDICQLQSLEVQGRLSSINSALRLLSFPHIQELKLWIEAPPSTDPSVSDSTTLLGADLSELFPSLLLLVIETVANITFDALRPILTLGRLQRLQFGSKNPRSNGIRLEDEHVCEMARAWPNLTGLVLRTVYSLVLRNCLLELARRCPRLRVLLINLVFDSVPTMDDLSLSSRPTMDAIVVSGGFPNLSDKDKVTGFVAALFPPHPDGRPEVD